MLQLRLKVILFVILIEFNNAGLAHNSHESYPPFGSFQTYTRNPYFLYRHYVQPAYTGKPNIIKKRQSSPQSAELIPNWNTIENHRAWDLLDRNECGESLADRIIGGTNAALGQYPWIARLGYTYEGDDEIEWMCGGVLISERHVITAAHCVEKNYDCTLKWVRAGEYDIRTNPDCQLRTCAPPVQDMGVKNVISHPSFNKPPLHNDIAIIVIKGVFNLNDYVAPICLPKKDQFKDVNVGELVIVAGWGKMNMSTDERADILQVVQLPVVSRQICDTFSPKGFKLTKGEICAGAQQNRDACGGDSGGPLMKVYSTDEGPKTFLTAVVSFGPSMCGIKKPGVYTSIPYFLKWVLDNIK